MPNLSTRSIATSCEINFPVSIRHNILGGQPGRVKEHVAAMQADCQPWEVILANSGDMAIHAALMATGEIMYFGGWFESTGINLFDPRSEARTNLLPGDVDGEAPETELPDTDMFCAGHAHLADGRLLVGGGEYPSRDEDGEDLHGHGVMSGGGERACYTYEPFGRVWTRVDYLNLDPDGNEHSGGRWYPTLTTLFDNQVISVGGHPDVREFYPADNQRHSNNTPERYTPWSDHWTLLLAETTAENAIRDEYHRMFLTSGGQIFFATQIKGANRFYNPYSGTFFASTITPPGESIYLQGSRGTAVVLPLLPTTGYRVRVLVCNALQPRLIDLGNDNEAWESDDWDVPSWQAAGDRGEWDGEPAPERNHACSVLLPDGRVFISGGTEYSGGEDALRQLNAVRHGEIYDPDIDWESGSFDGPGDWTRVAAASVERHYHSVALLMPNGTVWTAGSNGQGGESNQERRIEVYRPPYCALIGRPEVTASPEAIVYLTNFEVRTPQAASIQRVALLRNGSVTHAFDGDQRYVGLNFSHAGGDRLIVTAPPHSAIAPPGYYMLWIVDDEGRPCTWAPMVKVGAMSLRRSVAECGVNQPLSLLQDVFGIGGSTSSSLRRQINVVQRTCIF